MSISRTRRQYFVIYELDNTPVHARGMHGETSRIGPKSSESQRHERHRRGMLAATQAGVEKVNPYKLRHSYATLLRRGGVDVADVQELLAHKSSKTTQRYAAVIPEKLATATTAFQKLWRPSS